MPIERLFGWATWSERTPNGNVDLGRCQSLQAADADGDGLTDLICTYDYGENRTRTLVQRSNGREYSGWTAQQPTQETGFDVKRCRPLLSGDIDGDGRADLICPYDYGDESTATFVQLSLSTGYTAWTMWGPRQDLDMNRCAGMQAADSDDDSLTDLVCAYDLGGNETLTFVQHSSGTSFSPWTAQTLGLQTGFDVNRCRPMLSGDVDNDGRDDLICPYDYPTLTTATFVQLSQDPYTPWTLWGAQTAEGSFDIDRCTGMQAVDSDGDGRTDLVCPYDYGGNQTRTFVQSSSGTEFSGWTAQQATVETDFDVKRCEPLLSGDLNGDGHADLFCPYDYGSANTATFVQISRITGYGRWQRATDNTGAGAFELSLCRRMHIGDANGDGYSDLICPYDYGSASTATFVQAAAVYQVALPAVIGD